ncbi:MAG: FAD-dependent oxidoreductase [Propionibacteriales bacterium]|nr:FAD-dependent oxidoreductase [Propionibacteriales bacterium]
MAPVIVVGAGIAGLSCARVLSRAGLDVEVVNRGRKVGGRMASRRLDGRSADLGAAFFTVSDPRFAEVVDGWEASGLARPWTDTLTVLDAGAPARSTSGPMRWGTPGGIRSVVEDLAAGLEVAEGQVTVVSRTPGGTLTVDGRPAAAVVLAMPDPQARVLLGDGVQHEAARLDLPFDPVLALAAWWPERTWDSVAAPALFHGAFVNGDDDLAWIADDGRRRGDDAPVLVAHSTAAFALPHLFEPQAAAPAMVAAVRRVLEIPAEPTGYYLQRWSVARPARVRPEPFWLGEQNLGFCGDGWGPVSRVEGAFLSGLALGEALVARLG